MKKIDKRNVADMASLIPMQEGILFHYLKNPDSEIYFEQLSLSIEGIIDIKIFVKAWDFVIAANEMLRTVFRWENVENPVQIILRKYNLELRYNDLSKIEKEEGKVLLEAIKTRDRNEGFDLVEVPFRVTLCKLGKDRYEMIISSHHILYDGWSNGIILKEFFSVYDDLVGNRNLKKPRKNRFFEYVKWLRDQNIGEQEEYWNRYLSGFEAKTVLPLKSGEKGGDLISSTYDVKLEYNLEEKLGKFVRKNRLLLSAIFYCAFGILLQKYNNSNDVIFGTTVSGRSAKLEGIENIVGLFINTLPLRVKAGSDEKALDLLKKVNKVLHEREEYETTSLVKIKECSQLDNTEELFDSIVVIENYPLHNTLTRGKASLTISSYSMFEMTNYDLTVTITLSGHINIRFIYNKELFKQEAVERLSHHFTNILEDIIENPGKKLSEVDILLTGERRRLLFDFNDTGREYPGDKTIHSLFEEQMQKTPENTAVVGMGQGAGFMDNGNTSPLQSGHLTYRKLDREADTLARILIEKGVETKDIVSIMVERSVEMVIGIFAILKAEGAYLPIDPSYPRERIKYILSDSSATVLLTTRSLNKEVEKLRSLEVETIFFEDISIRQEAVGIREKQCRGESMYSPVSRDIEAVEKFRSLEKDTPGHVFKEPATCNLKPVTISSNLCYIIYTSGSTGRSKGVLVGHRSVVNMLTALQREYPLKGSDTYLLKTSYVFDVSAAELFGWFFEGGKLAILEQGKEKNPGKIIDAIESADVTHINFVPSMFNLFLDELNAQNLSKLSCLKYIFLAGEALLPGLVKRFRDLNTKITLENIYGPTEGTIYSSKYSLSDWDGKGSVPIGKSMQNIKLFILDKDNNLQPIGVPGELCIAGENLARGYLNQPELTAEKFIDIASGGQLFERSWTKTFVNSNIPTFHYSNIPTAERSEARLYFTGDLARWLQDGNIEYLGRIDHQVKIRGFRIELGEIENRLLNHDRVNGAVVTVKEDGSSDKYLCAYIVPKSAERRAHSAEPVEGNLVFHPDLGREIDDVGAQRAEPPEGGGSETLDIAEIREYLSQTLPDYMIPSYFVSIEELPLTATGKVDRKALPDPEIKAGRGYEAPRSDTERKLAGIWAEILNTVPQAIGIDDHFFELGGHSLKATRLLTKIHREFDVSVTLTDFFKNPTIRWLSVFIEKTTKNECFISIKAAEDKEYYPLSVTQKRFFFFQQLEPDNISYNMSEMLLIEGRLEKEKFSTTFGRLIHRHESLRTSFTVTDGQPVQKIHKARDIKFAVEYYETGTVRPFLFSPGEPEIGSWHPGTGITDRFLRAFDLSCAPLLRVGLMRVEKEKYILMVDMHHIISDGTSTGIFIADFLSIYKGEELSSLRIRYRDYVYWMLGRINKKRGSSMCMNSAAGDAAEELLELPSDYIRPAVQSFEGAKVKFEIGKGESEALNLLSLKEETTLFIVIFAVYNIFLSKLSGQENIIVGCPIAGRQHDDLEGIIGLFINTLAIRSFPSAGKRFTQFLGEVRENSLQTFDKQEYQYEELVEKIEMVRDSSRNPLFDVMFVLQNMEMPELDIPGLKIKRNIYEDRASKFDMTLFCEELGETFLFTFEYCTKLFKQETIKRFVGYFKKILSAVLQDPEKEIGKIEFITGEEKREILYDFNDTAVEYPRDKTIYRLFEDQAARTPENTALIAGAAGEGAGITLTYRQFNERANRLARVLRGRGVKANNVVGIMLERSIDLVVGLYAVLKAGGAYLPIDPEYPERRILSMLQDSKSVMLLTKKEVVEEKKLARIPQDIIMVDELVGLISDQPGGNLQPLSQPEDLIYVIFTSGSTGVPKGAGVYQRSFVNLMNWFVKDFALNEADINLLMTSFSFDLTQKNFYASLILGGILCIPAVNYFDPGEILREIEASGITWINCTPSMFFQMIEFCKEEELKKMETLRYVYLGGESISMSMYMKWIESEYCRGVIVNTYGPTECTDISNAYRITDPRRFLKEVVPLGKPIYNVQLVVVDRNLQLLPVGIAGELLIVGESVGMGYVNDRELTEKKFVWHSFESGEPLKLFYRTGDLVKWLPDGNIEFLGRMDYQVKIRGFRIEIGEIESKLLEYEKIKEAVVIDKNDESGGKYLCAYFVPTCSLPHAAAELREFLSRTLPDYMIPSYFVELEEMPLNPNGKVNRKALPVPEIVSKREYAAPRNELDDLLVSMWAEILGLEKGRIGIDDNFFELGGHSLKATELTARIHQKLNVEIPLREIFKIFKIRDLSEYISREGKSRYMSIGLVEEKEYYSLSSAQQRLFLLQQMNMESAVYNIPFAALLEGDLDNEKLQGTFLQLIERHESLRTSFHMLDGRPMQKIHNPDSIEFKIEYDSAEQLETLHPVTSTIENFIRPFDLSCAPLLRVGVLIMEEKKHLLMMDMHHIISDGVSLNLFIEDFMSIYSGETLPPLRMRYRDYSEWQNSRNQSETLKRHEEYWLREFAGEIPVLDIPSDFPRSPIQDFAGTSLQFEIEHYDTEKLRSMALYEDSTLYMVLLSLFNIFLSKLSGHEVIIIGSPVAGRTHGDLEQVIGIFINTLPLKNFPAGQKSFEEFLKELGDRTLSAFENQEYQFEDLVEKVLVERDINRNPLFDVMFVLQNMDIPEIEIAGLKLSPYGYQDSTAKFDMTFNCEESAGKLLFKVQYRIALFRKETIEKFIKYFRKVLSQVVDNREVRIGEIEIISDEEKREILVDFNDSGAGYPGDKTVHQLFEEQAARTPDHIAVFCPLPGKGGNISLVYQELNEKADVLAGILRIKGLKAFRIAAIEVDRSLEMIVGLLAILKADGAYLPISPEYPEERKSYILRDSNAKLLLTSGNFYEDFEKFRCLGVETVLIDEIISNRHKSSDIGVGAQRTVPEPTPPFEHPSNKEGISSGNLAYIIYTSGTTGKPKGVLVEHSSVVNVVTWFGRQYGLQPGFKVLQMSDYTFDASVNQIFGTLLHGAELYVITKHLLLDIDALYTYIKDMGIHLINFVPQLLRELLWYRNKPENLRIVISGAEKLENELKDKILERGYQLYNHYGPTEATIDALAAKCSADKVNLGKPIANAACYILDRYGNILPVGVTGELVVSGSGVARGYLNNPELTAEKFVSLASGGQLFEKSWTKTFVNSNIPAADRSGARLYFTGDQARWLPDGSIEFLGRIDQQVKIRGFRIELGEIENRLLENEDVKEAVVIDRQPDAGGKYLCAYIVPKSLARPKAATKPTPPLRGTPPVEGNPEHFIDSSLKVLSARSPLERGGPPQAGRGVLKSSQKNKIFTNSSAERKAQSAETVGGNLEFPPDPDREIDDGGAQRAVPSEESNSETLDIIKIRDHLSHTLPDYMIPTYFVELGQIPLNPNGKVDRNALPVPDASKAVGEYTAPRNELEKRLVGIWSGVLNIPAESIGIDTDFFQAGGHSLKATLLTARIHKEFDVSIKLAEIFTMPTIRKLSAAIESAVKVKYLSIEAVEDREYYPLSSAQKRLYLLQQMNPESTGYHISEVVILDGDLQKEKLQDTFGKLIARHESLRTSFFVIEEEPVQRIHSPEDIEFKIEYNDSNFGATSDEAPLMAPQFIRPFDLSCAPLLRVGLIPFEKKKHILVVDMHHIVSDGTSIDIFIKEFMLFYRGDVLPELRLHYRDYSEWQREWGFTGLVKNQEEFWLHEFREGIPVLDLPTDYARPQIQSFAGNRVNFHLNKGETAGLKQLARKEGATMYMVLLVIINVLLSKLSSQEDIVVGTTAAGRGHADLEPIIGMFVNTLVLRNYPVPGKTFTRFINEVKERTLGAFENQEYQFEDLVERLSVNRDASRNPLFDVMFVFRDMEQREMEFPGLKLKPYEYNSRLSKFDLTFFASESEGRLAFTVEYCTKLFKEETIERFLRYFKKIILSLLVNPGDRISHIDIMSEEEKLQVLCDFNDTAAEYPENKTVHRLFSDQVEMTPDKIAVAFEDQRMTYKELDKESDRLELILRGKGFKREYIAGIMLERSVEMVSGLLGILKSGGAYLPVDPDYPEERQCYVLEDCCAKVILTTVEFSEKVEKYSNLGVEMIFLEEIGSSSLTKARRAKSKEQSGIYQDLRCAPGALRSASSSENLAYIIYTSGSTGRPKGVMVIHRNIVRLVKNTNYIEFKEDDRILQTGALEFDASTFEVWGSLLNGITLYLAGKDEILNAGILGQMIRRCKISTMWLTAPLFNQLSTINIEIFTGLRNLLVGGDVLSPSHINPVRVKYPGLHIINGYGPTENTTFSTTFLIDREYEENISIGKPIANSTAYIIDKSNQLLPVGVLGELCVGGDGVARGYLNRPELTAEKFMNELRTQNSEVRMHSANSEYLASGGQLFEKSWTKTSANSNIPSFLHSTLPVAERSGAKLYRTGDLCRWLPTGNIEFIGRIDQQVKIRGFRIELSEIENRLLEQEAVQEAVVIDRISGEGEKYLCAYIVPKSLAQPEAATKPTPPLRGTPPLEGNPEHFIVSSLKVLSARSPLERGSAHKIRWAIRENATIRSVPPLTGPPQAGRGVLKSSQKNKIFTHSSTERRAHITEPVGGKLVFPLDPAREIDDVGAQRAVPSEESNSETLDIIKIRDHLSHTLPDYMIPTYFVELGQIPLNPNGKVDRNALPVPDASKAVGEYTAPRNELEKRLVGIWSGVLNIPAESIGIDTDFFQAGGHSLKATLLTGRIHKEFDASIKLAEIFTMPTIRKLSAAIESAVKVKYLSIEAVEDREYYPLSSAQKRLFLLQQMNPESTGYHIPEVITLDGDLQKEKLQDTFGKLIARHESLRTSFFVIEEEPVQRIHSPEDIEFEIEYVSAERKAQSAEQLEAYGDMPEFIIHNSVHRFIRPFDLSCAPLLRVGLIPLEKKKHILVVDMHHIITDGTSMGILTGEFMLLYAGETLPPLGKQYRDFSKWQNTKKESEALTQQKEYWLDEFAGEIPVLDLPTDFPRPLIQDFSGDTLPFNLDANVTEKLKTLAEKQGATLYMVLMALFNVLLTRLSGQEDIIVGTPAAGRIHHDLEPVIGMFVNTLVLRNYPAGEKTFREFLREVKHRTLKAQENQEFQFEDLVEEVDVNRDIARNPLFDVMFVMQNMEIPEFEIRGLKMKRNLREGRTSKFDMTLYCEERGGILAFELEYCTKLFKPDTTVKYVSYFKKIISAVLADPSRTIGEIEFISDKEKHEILYDFNNMNVTYPRDRTIYRLFEEQAARTPGNIAVVGKVQEACGTDNSLWAKHSLPEQNGDALPLKSAYLTYRELNERANRLARVLRAKGMKANSVVGIMLERSLELIEGLYAVLKAGGAYLPIDPEYPEKRILSMLENSKSVILLTKKEVVKRKNLPPIPQEIVKIDEIAGVSADQSGENMKSLSQPADLIYVIFTSGSTGVPKGAGVYQRSFVNLVNWFVKDFELNDADTNLLMTSFSFDLTQKNLYASLVLGGKLCLPAVNYFDPGEILRQIEEEKITWINCTPSMFFQLIEFCKEDELKKLETLRYVYLGGESISMGMFMKWVDSEYCHGEIVNTYGPTECTDISNSFRITEPHRFLRKPVPIGAPIYNVRLVVTDSSLQLLPVGIAGELLIGGDSVGFGYINDRELTGKKFVRCAFEKGKPDRLFYRTGDLVRWLPEGNVEFLGRTDCQVKIRGFRVELGEIENRLLEHETVKDAVVIDRQSDAGDKYLCAYIVPKDSDREVKSGELREFLLHSLPDYMVPAFFIRIEMIPLSPNGKVDRKALPDPGSAGLHPEVNFVAPRNQLEESISRIWQEVLELPRVGIHDNFFDIGGNSLNVIRVGAKMKQELAITIPLVTMFRYTTVSVLAAHLSQEDMDETIIREEVDRSTKVEEGKKRRLQKINKRRLSIND